MSLKERQATVRKVFRAILICFGILLAMVIMELGLRIYYSDGGIPAAHLEHTSDEQHTSFVENEECGYLPITGRGEYDAYGCLANDYNVDNKTAPRVLFTGDSVTHRARIVNALKKLYGEDTYEYWNAGVESFNTLQEWVFFREYNHKIKPDQVVLTFHNNDFRATPMVVRERGQIKVYQPGLDINPWLFRKSYLYRWAWPKGEDRGAREKQVQEGLLGFRDALKKDNVPFVIILHPMLKPVSEWDDKEKRSRELSLQYFKEHDLKVIDLLPTLEKAIADGINLTESEGDYLHPSDELSARFAQQIYNENALIKP